MTDEKALRAERREADRVSHTGDLHEGVESEGGLWVARVACDAVVGDELEVVELAPGAVQVVIEVLHHLPGAIADAHHHDGEWPARSLHDGADRVRLVRHLPVSHNHQDVVLRHRRNRLRHWIRTS